jgi:uncharacterized membrane protein
MRTVLVKTLKQALLVLLVLGFSLLTPRQTWADQVAVSQTVQAGATALYQLEVRNETGLDHTYVPALTGLPNGLTITFSTGGSILKSVPVLAGGAVAIQASVETTTTTPVGVYAGDFIATRDDSVVVTMPVTIMVENTYALKIVSQSVNLFTFSGQSFTFDISAVNAGVGQLSNVLLKVDVPAKWIVQTEPQQVSTLEPGADVALHVQVAVPPSQIAIDQPVTLKVVSDQTSSPEGQLLVRVQKNPNYLFVAGGIMALAVVGVFVYFRVNGRR